MDAASLIHCAGPMNVVIQHEGGGAGVAEVMA